jgi:histone chaperone ASF1
VIVTCHYKTKEFLRVGYWVSNAYEDPIPEGEEPPKPIDLSKVVRSVLSRQPRVTRFPVDWT